MVSQADRELINNFVNELRPYLETVETGVQQFSQPNRDGVTVGQAVQALMMVRGAGQILMVDGLVSISSWLVESFEKVQNNPDISPAEATRRLSGLYSAMDDYLVALDRGDDVDPIVLRAKTIFEAIPTFGGPLPGTGKLRPRTDLDALFGKDDSTAPTDRITTDDSADTEKLAAQASSDPADQTAEIPHAGPTVPLQAAADMATRPVTDQPARIVPVPPQPTEELPEVDPELREIFQEEALEIIAAFGDGIRELARNPSNQDAIRNLNRAAHTLKGAANMTGFPLIAQIGAAIEQLFDEQLDRGQPVGRDVLELVAVSWKMLRAMAPKLNDLSGFTSPSNSIVQRANVLREQLAQTVADAETIQIDRRQSQATLDPAAQDTDEIVAIDVQAPARRYEPVDVDPYMVEAAPTVPLRRDPVAEAPAEPAPADEIVVSEPEAFEPTIQDSAVDADSALTKELEEAASSGPTSETADQAWDDAPFWSSAEPSGASAVEADARPQSEPFWTPGTDELMRTAVQTDRLIADLHGIDELVEEITEDTPVEESDSFFTGIDIDADEAGLEPAAEEDDGDWIDAPDKPATDLLDFEAGPQTEPFWNEIDELQPEALVEPEPDEPVTMDPFFEPVEVPTSFFSSEILEDVDTVLDELVDDVEAPTAEIPAIEYDLVAEAQPGTAVHPVDLVDTPAPVESEQFEIVDLADEQAVDVESHGRPDHEAAIGVAFDSDLAQELARVSLELPDVAFNPVLIVTETEDSRVEAPEFDESHWAEMEAPVPFDLAFVHPDNDHTGFDVLALADDGLAIIHEALDRESDDQQPYDVVVDEFWTPADTQVEVAEDVMIEDFEVADSAGTIEAGVVDAGADEFWTPVRESDEILVDAVEETDNVYQTDEFVPDEDLVIVEEDALDEAEIQVDASEESFDEMDAGEPAEDTVLELEDDLALSELDEVIAGMDSDELSNLEWFDLPDESSEIEVETDGADIPDDLPAVEHQEPTPTGTGFLGGSGTGSLRNSGADSLGFGSLDLDRFLTHEGSVALSSALLDMAFATPAGATDLSRNIEDGTISMFDESSDRALEIEMFETFALEAEDHINILNRAAMQFDRDPFAAEPVIDIKRALHTIKGAAAAADFGAISELAHQLEDALAARERLGTLGDRTFVPELYDAIEEIEAILAHRKDELFGITDGEQESATLRVDVGHVDGMLNTVGELVVNRSSFEERLERLESTIEDLATAAARLQRSSYLLEREANAEDAIGRLLRGEINGHNGGLVINRSQRDWDTLEMDRYTEFDRLIRQLAEVGADVGTAVGEIASLRGDFDTISTRQRRLTTALQDELMGIRMVPISSLMPRLYRVVRRAAGSRGKKVNLAIEGGDTQFDKILLDTLSESLLHLLRNAVDHGIEEAGERRRLGKPEHGTIRIRAFRDGSEAVIEIIDDGAGIDPQFVIQYANEHGLAVTGDMTREEALGLIFIPGFSTRVKADEISGRGLGLEIVEQTVSRYKGRVAVDSVPGRGTIFSLRLPVMLSVIQAFLVTAGDGDFAIPVANVDYVVDRIDQPLTQIGKSIVVETSGQIIPVVDVGARLGGSSTPVLERTSGWIMVTEVGGKRWALVVDDLHGQQEIVVKPMGRFLRAMPGLMGATILGHGDVALIVDVPALLGADSLVTRLDNVALPAKTKSAGEPAFPGLTSSDQGHARVVLVVDDSLSVRRVVSRTLERHGWVALLARDGVEALELLEQGQVDVILTDIEMPRMDGFELVSTVRSREDDGDTPIVVLTSRSGGKHRERALSLGANEYLVKPFQEQELINVIESAVRVTSHA